MSPGGPWNAWFGLRSRTPLAGRHRHAEDVRSDGLAVVLGAVLRDRRVAAVTLADVHSGMVLDSYAADVARWDLEMLGARHAELFRVGLGVLCGAGGAPSEELVVSPHDGCHHVLRLVPDPVGGHLVLSAVLHGRRWDVVRVRRLLRQVPVAALTAGPTFRRRPVAGSWGPVGPEWVDAESRAARVGARPVPGVRGPAAASRRPGGPPSPTHPDIPAARPDIPAARPGGPLPGWPARTDPGSGDRPPSPPSAMPTSG